MDRTVIYGRPLGRTATRKEVRLGCFNGTLEEALHAKIRGLPEADRVECAAQSTHYHILKDDTCTTVRATVARHCAVENLEYFVTDKAELVRIEVATRTRVYDDVFMHDESWVVRLCVARCTTNYYEHFAADSAPCIREWVAANTTEYHSMLAYDTHPYVRAAVARSSTQYHGVLSKDRSNIVIRAIQEEVANIEEISSFFDRASTNSEAGVCIPYSYPGQALSSYDVVAWSNYEVPENNLHADMAERILGL